MYWARDLSSGPHLISSSLGPTRVHIPNRHLDRFSRFCSAHDRYRPTDHATPSAAIGCIASAAMRRKNESRVWWPCATFRLETYWVSSCSAGSRVLQDSLLGIKVLTTIYFLGDVRLETARPEEWGFWGGGCHWPRIPAGCGASGGLILHRARRTIMLLVPLPPTERYCFQWPL